MIFARPKVFKSASNASSALLGRLQPLLSKDTWKLLDFIIQSPEPNRNLKLSVNTNLGIPDNLFNKFVEKVDKLIEEERVKEFIIFTSVDGWGEQAEYIRNGLVFNKFWDNINLNLLNKSRRKKKKPSVWDLK